MIRVRRAGPADIDRIDGIEGASFEADRFARRNLLRMLEGGRTRFLLADTDEGRAGGYLALSLRAGSRVARIYSLAVDPAARKQGLAQALLEAARDEARRAGCRVLRLEVRAGNDAARRLYESAGFHLRRERKAYYEDGETALVLDQDLTPSGPVTPSETSPS